MVPGSVKPVMETPCPCAKCGSNHIVKLGDSWDKTIWIKCGRCGNSGPQAPSLPMAIRLWNMVNNDAREVRK